MADVAAGRLEGLGSPEVTAREVDERRGRTRAQLVDELAGVRDVVMALGAAFDDAASEAPAPGGYDGTRGDGVGALWYDAGVHGGTSGPPWAARPDGAGRAPQHPPHRRAPRKARSGPGHAVVRRRRGPGHRRGGRTFSGDPLPFIMAATGRDDPSALDLDASVNLYA